jgi:hypothetical protein
MTLSGHFITVSVVQFNDTVTYYPHRGALTHKVRRRYYSRWHTTNDRRLGPDASAVECHRVYELDHSIDPLEISRVSSVDADHFPF